MDLFQQIIKLLGYGALGFTAVEIYLTVNKLWKRKHEKAVAESISIMAKLVGMVPLTLFTLDNLLSKQWRAAIDSTLWLSFELFALTIGLGIWVAGGRIGFWRLFGKALKLERSEALDLAKLVFRPSAADRILDVLRQVALLDDLDEREKKLIQIFADNWRIDVAWDDFLSRRAADRGSRFTTLRASVAEYLATNPPSDQAAELSDVISRVVKADEKVTPEEEIVEAELAGMLAAYCGDVGSRPSFYSAIVPQSADQDQAMATLLPGLERRTVPGGIAYLAGPFFSHGFAEEVTKQHRALNFFSIVVDAQEIEGLGTKSVTSALSV